MAATADTGDNFYILDQDDSFREYRPLNHQELLCLNAKYGSIALYVKNNRQGNPVFYFQFQRYSVSRVFFAHLADARDFFFKYVKEDLEIKLWYDANHALLTLFCWLMTGHPNKFFETYLERNMRVDLSSCLTCRWIKKKLGTSETLNTPFEIKDLVKDRFSIKSAQVVSRESFLFTLSNDDVLGVEAPNDFAYMVAFVRRFVPLKCEHSGAERLTLIPQDTKDTFLSK